jgi:hypothetical protein
MHRENHYYGHAEILAAAAGLERPRRIAGYLQHGWQVGTGVVPDCARNRWPKLVWSSRNLDACRREGIRRAVATGAPFLYLPPEEDPGPERDALLAFPYHGWLGGEVDALERAYEEYAASLETLRADGFEAITVCMYWLEHRREELREIFARRGFEVTTAGNGLTDPEHLPRLRRLVRAHAHVTSNRIATCTFYALASGRPFFLHGPAMVLRGSAAEAAAEKRAFEEREFPELRYDRYEGRVAGETARRELGAEHRLDASALREVLGWEETGPMTRFARAVDTGSWRLARGLWRLVRRRSG